MKALTLLYHDVILPGDYGSSGFQSPDANIYKLDRGEFASHMAAIADRTGRQAIPVSEAVNQPGMHFLLAFDDGGASAHSLIADLLEERGWRGHFFVTTDYISKPGFLTPAEIRSLRKRGHIIGSHSCSHPARMAKCQESMMDREWRDSIAVLSDMLGERMEAASVPGGYFSPAVARSAARAGIRFLFNSEPVTSLRTVEGCLVLGRFSVQRGISADWAAAVASGALRPRVESYLFWNAKKLLKKAGGEYWLEFRRRVLAARQE